jgi:hypothetical protein
LEGETETQMQATAFVKEQWKQIGANFVGLRTDKSPVP